MFDLLAGIFTNISTLCENLFPIKFLDDMRYNAHMTTSKYFMLFFQNRNILFFFPVLLNNVDADECGDRCTCKLFIYMFKYSSSSLLLLLLYSLLFPM